MKNNRNNRAQALKSTLLFIGSLLTLMTKPAFAQQFTAITGIVRDKENKEPLAYATIVAKGTGKDQGVIADENGEFELESNAPVKHVVVSYIGYKPVTLALKPGRQQNVTIDLQPLDNALDAVTVRAKRKRYTNKENPAVDLIKKAIEHKKANRLEAFDYWERQAHQRMEIGLCDMGDSVKNKLLFKQFPVLLTYIDTSPTTGRVGLPLFLREVLIDEYYRRKPEAFKQVVQANRQVDFSAYLSDELINPFLEGFVGQSDIYANDIMVLDNDYMSPLSPAAPAFYRFHIMDTVDINGTSCIEVSMHPRVTTDFGFRGYLYITNDSNYAIRKADLRLTSSHQVNFVNYFQMVQEYELINGAWCLVRDQTTMDFGLTKGRSYLVGTRTTTYRHYAFDQPQPPAVYQGINTVVYSDSSKLRSSEYWEQLRHEPLTKTEQGVYSLIDTLQQTPKFRAGINLVNLATSGYLPMGKIDLGPVNSLASYNHVEGIRTRVGFKTNALMHPHWFFSAYGAYGFDDKVWKYETKLTYSFRKRKMHQWEFPQHALSLAYTHDAIVPGQTDWDVANDRFLLSFVRGRQDRMVYNKGWNLDYIYEHTSGLAIQASMGSWSQTPAGSLVYRTPAGNAVDALHISQATLGLRFAPNERFYQSQASRFPLNHTNPVVQLQHSVASSTMLGQSHYVQHTEFALQKRWWISSLGYFDMDINAGHVWGVAPFPLLVIHRANQNWHYSTDSYNMMNFMEFVSDSYAGVNFSHSFNGLFFNRIPLLRKLKWREVVTLRSLWGQLSDANNPAISTASNRILSFNDAQGIPHTFALDPGKPYMEAGVAVDNILKVIRIDYVWRLSYKENPNTPHEWWEGFRFMLHWAF